MTEKRRTREELKRQREQQKKSQKKPVMTWVKRIAIVIVAIGIIGLLSGVGLFTYYASSAPALDEELLKDPISSEFYDTNGEIFATIGTEDRKYIEYDEIPQDMIDAILATEDVRFFDHFGIDIWRLGSAVVANVTQGFGAQGASTITQQVVKNSFLSNDKQLKRKAQEAWLAIQLERQYTKEEIFEMYFNKILMSGRIYGFGTAAEYFYGKELSELSLDEMALLAGIPQSPNNYNPFKHPDRAEKRRNIVLDLMLQHGKITADQAAEAKAVEVTAGLLPEDQRQSIAGSKYDAFLDVVLTELEKNGDGELLAEGLKVYTTLDPNAQSVVENVMDTAANFPTENIQSGVAVIDTKTGQIKAIGGGRNYADRDYNFAQDLTTRSPGSTLKPLVDYGPAIEHLNWSTGQTTVDERMTYEGSNQVIRNWDGKYLGTMTIRQALYQSRNVPAVKTLQEVGLGTAQEFISKLGIDVDYLVQSDAIGGGRVNLSPIQMAASFAAFGNNGIYNDPYSVKEIVFRDGSKISYKPEPVVAMKDSTAYMVTDILRDVLSDKPGASGTTANISWLDIAGKTGTTNYSADEFTKYNLPDTAVPDSWFAGYTTNYSISIWSGYSKRSEPITTWDERLLPQKLFRSIMSEISANVETAEFKKPDSVVEATIEVGTNPLKLATRNTPYNLRQTELFAKGTEPTQYSNNYVEQEKEEEEEASLNAPSNLQGNYNNAGGTVDLTWEFTPPESGNTVEFEVTTTVDGGEGTFVGTTATNQASVPNIEAGRNYTFSVVAVSNGLRSAPATVSMYIDNGLEQPEVENPDGFFEDEFVPGEQENNNGNNNGNNGNGNGNGNNGNNGNGNGNNGNNGNGNGKPNEEEGEDWELIPNEEDGYLFPTEPTEPTNP